MALGRKSDTEFLAERLGDRVPVVVFSVDRHQMIDDRTDLKELLVIDFKTEDAGTQPNLRAACEDMDTDDKRVVAFSRDERGNWNRLDKAQGDLGPVGVPFLRAALDRALRAHMEETARSSRVREKDVLKRAAADSHGSR